MSAPFNREARKRALDLWMAESHILSEAQTIGPILMDGNVSEANELRDVLRQLRAFAHDMQRAIQGIDEEDA